MFGSGQPSGKKGVADAACLMKGGNMDRQKGSSLLHIMEIHGFGGSQGSGFCAQP